MGTTVSLRSKTIGDAITELAELFNAHELFFGHGMETAYDEAAYLVSFVAEIPPDFGSEQQRLPLQSAQLSKLEALAEQRIHSRKPLAYLLGKTWLAGYPFLVSEKVLIPRSPISEWIPRQFQPWVNPTEVHRVLDLCTGSGCLGILAAHNFEKANVDLIDIDPNALELAKANIRLHGLERRVFAYESDLFEELASQQYDIIVANPPYVPFDEKNELPKEYGHEPEHALYADQDGLAIAEKILARASDHLSPHGILVLELGYSVGSFARKHPAVSMIELELERGGEGVLLFQRDDCVSFAKNTMP